jgi:hypothetical protein
MKALRSKLAKEIDKDPVARKQLNDCLAGERESFEFQGKTYTPRKVRAPEEPDYHRSGLGAFIVLLSLLAVTLFLTGCASTKSYIIKPCIEKVPEKTGLAPLKGTDGELLRNLLRNYDILTIDRDLYYTIAKECEK